jgi:methylene-tetrahydromethanopterin dehydrogenase
MADKHILHMITPLKHMSPFDINMAADAGFDVISTYTNVLANEVTGLVQDAIFSRPPSAGAKTAFFIAGKNALEALDMLDTAKKALVPPFEVSLFADPAGSFTTAAAMVACVEKVLRGKKKALKDMKVAVFGATGVVGFSSSVLTALEGAKVTMVGYDGPARVEKAAADIAARFGVKPGFADGSTDKLKSAILAETEIALCAGRAGVQILSKAQIAAAPKLLVAADVNAVPPTGVEGLDFMANGSELVPGGAVGLGPLAVGNVKYQTEAGLFKKMIAASKPVTFDFRDAFALAREFCS